MAASTLAVSAGSTADILAVAKYLARLLPRTQQQDGPGRP